MADTGRSYHIQATGAALATIEQHATDADITLFGACFCPFVQRVWAALEYLGIPYKYYEVDPYQKPKELLELSPKGLVPALRLDSYTPPRALNESNVILDYLDDLAGLTTQRSLLPPLQDPYARSLVRLQTDHINRALVPAFYRCLQAQDPAAQAAGSTEFLAAVDVLVGLFQRAEREVGVVGLWTEGGKLTLADVAVSPWIFRATNVLKDYRGLELPQDAKFQAWLARLLAYPAFACTCSTEQLYMDSYERYAFNRPHTSQVADAINSGKGLP